MAGNSLGGWVALELAAAGRAASVTAIAPAGLWAEPLVPKRTPVRAVARALLPVLAPLLRTERGRRIALAANAAHPERIPPDAALRLVRAYATAPGFQAVNDAMRASRFTRLARHHRAGHARLAGPRPPRQAPAVAARGGAKRRAARLRAPADVGRPRPGG